MGISAIISAVAAVAGVAQNQMAQQQQKKASKQAQAQAEKAYQQADEANNRANQKKPNVAALMSQNQGENASTTSLTGPSGIDPNSLQLGKQTLLGS